MHWFYGANEPTPANILEPIANMSRIEWGSRLMFLKNPSGMNDINEPADTIKVLELMNLDVEMPPYDDTLYWCKIFKINEFMDKSQIIKVRRKFFRCHVNSMGLWFITKAFISW